MSRLPQYPGQPTRSIVDAVDVLAETGPIYAGDKAGEWNDWYRRAVPAAAHLYLDYLTATGQR